MKISQIKINKVKNSKRLKAYVGFVLNDCFAVNNARIIDGKNGLFVAMPSSETKNGHKDYCHPITTEFRKEMESLIIEEYNKLNEIDRRGSNE